MNRKIIDQVKIEGFQNFQQYMKINPKNIRINDSEIQSKLLFYSKKNISIDLLLTVYYLVLQLKKIQKLFLLQPMV